MAGIDIISDSTGKEIVAAIKDKYPNVNYNWPHTWEKITDAVSKSIDAIRDHFKN